jgi:hypothetical protein
MRWKNLQVASAIAEGWDAERILNRSDEDRFLFCRSSRTSLAVVTQLAREGEHDLRSTILLVLGQSGEHGNRFLQ